MRSKAIPWDSRALTLGSPSGTTIYPGLLSYMGFGSVILGHPKLLLPPSSVPWDCVGMTKDLTDQKALLNRFADWTGRTKPVARKKAMTLWLNSIYSPDLGRHISEDTLKMWFYRNAMPDDVREAIEYLLAFDAQETGSEPWCLDQARYSMPREPIRIDMASPNASQQLAQLQSQEAEHDD